MKKILSYFFLILFSTNSLIFAQKDPIKNNFLIGLSAAKSFNNEYPVAGFINFGYEYKITPPSNGYYFVTEGRVRGGFFSYRTERLPMKDPIEKLDYNNMIVSVSIIPRFYLEFQDEFSIFFEGELGGAYHYIRADITKNLTTKKYVGDALSPLCGIRIGVKTDVYSLWGGYLNIKSKDAINSVVPIALGPNNHLDGEVGFSFYF